jgi:hypothetical protein
MLFPYLGLNGLDYFACTLSRMAHGKIDTCAEFFYLLMLRTESLQFGKTGL